MLAAPAAGVPPLTETPEALREVCERFAAGTGPVAVDAERASGFRYSQRAYLAQFKREGAGIALVDTARLPDLGSLSDALDGVEWVLHAASQDLPCLREAGMEPSRVFDTELAARLLQDRTTLAFGVARHQLIIDGVATDPNHPVLRRLAETLHHHQLGAMSILPGVEPYEIHAAIHALADEPVSGAVDPDAAPVERLPDWPHVRLHPLTLDRLELIDDEPGGTPPDGDSEPARRRAHATSPAATG